MLKKMVIPGERIAGDESEDTADRDSVQLYPGIASIGDIGESSDISTDIAHLVYYHLIHLVLVYHHLPYSLLWKS